MPDAPLLPGIDPAPQPAAEDPARAEYRERLRQYLRAPDFRAIVSITASNADLELWLLACMLRVHSAEELPLADLLDLPALFPFHLTVKTGDLRRSSRFETQQQGAGWDSVRLRKVVSA